MVGKRQKRSSFWARWVGTLGLVLLLAACTSSDFHWITPVPPDGEPPAAEAAATETPAEEAVAAAVDPASEEKTEAEDEAAAEDAAAESEAAEGEAAEGEAAEVAGEDGGSKEAAPITHPLAEREACTECHEAGGGRRGSPPDHAHLTDQVCVYCHMPEEGEAAIPPLPERAETDFCLGCHGPHDDLMAATADYVNEDGLAGNPHMYIPHNGTNISSCRNCHKVHELPVTAPDMIEQATVDFCFAACHHEGDYEPCSACHDEDE